jgi:hypothetical protein
MEKKGDLVGDRNQEDGRKTLDDKENGGEKRKAGCCGSVNSKK